MEEINIYGYMRVSSKEQNEDRQKIALTEMGVPENNIYMDTGVVKGTIVQKPDFMGRKAVELLTRINNGEELTETVIDSGVTFVTAENVDTYKDAQ